MLDSLQSQTCPPDQVVIVDTGPHPDQGLIQEFPRLNMSYTHLPGGSISSARNQGANLISPATSLIGFGEDDAVWEPNAVQAMLNFWDKTPRDLGGAGFNFHNSLPTQTARQWRLPGMTAFYRAFLGGRPSPGRVRRTGYPTPIYPAKETIYVDWLEGISVWRVEVLRQFRFDEFFAGYGYSEQLDFSYRVGKVWRLAVVAEANVAHYPGPVKNNYLFGRKQIINRVHFVRKHQELSFPRCLAALVVHTAFNAAAGLILQDTSYFRRAWGNCAGFAQLAAGRLEPVEGAVK
jgi:glycosyltransferase involved in cell wall biosynthesis